MVTSSSRLFTSALERPNRSCTWFDSLCTGLRQISSQLVCFQNYRSVLNMPAHVSRISTADLCRLHDIQDPVQVILAKLRKRLRKLLRKTTTGPDITSSPHVVQVLRDKIHHIETLPEPEGEPVLSHACQDCGGLRAVCTCTARASTPAV